MSTSVTIPPIRRQNFLNEKAKKRLLEYLEDGHTQREVAEALQVTESAVSHIIAGRRGLSYPMAKRLSLLLSLDLSSVWYISDI